ncbi:MAG: hypothetical protein WBE82_18435 [Xanthobacteraceae bacterium]
MLSKSPLLAQSGLAGLGVSCPLLKVKQTRPPRGREPDDPEMKRLPIRGASLLTPRLGEDKLKQAFADLRVIAVYTDAEIREVYFLLASVCGRYLAEEEAKQVDPVAKALLSTGKNLREASRLLNGRSTGFHDSVELEVTAQVIDAMTSDPTDTQSAPEFVAAFQVIAARIAEACLIAHAKLSKKASNDGPSPMLWYDDFTAILFGIARKAGIKPNLNKDRVSQQYGGWLFEAAQALEPFLDPDMRSETPGACGKRLERSRKRLLKTDRQDPGRR